VDLPAPRSPARTARGAPAVVGAAGAQQFAHGHAHAAQRGVVALLQQLADHQPFGRRGGDVADEFGQRALQCARHLQQHQDRGIAHAVFQVCQVAFGDVGSQRQRLARHAAARASAAALPFGFTSVKDSEWCNIVLDTMSRPF
jgi:hypothetical protein